MRIPIPLILAALIVAAGFVVFYVNYIPDVPAFVWTNINNGTTFTVVNNNNNTMPAFFVVSNVPVIVKTNTTATMYYISFPVTVIYSPNLLQYSVVNDGIATWYKKTALDGTTIVYTTPGMQGFAGSVGLVHAGNGIWVPSLCTVYYGDNFEICKVFIRYGTVVEIDRNNNEYTTTYTISTLNSVTGTELVLNPRPSTSPYPDVKIYRGYLVAINVTAPTTVWITKP